MIAIIDYGVGNLFSLQRSFQAIGENAIVTNNINLINSASKIVLPGVGAFGDASHQLRETGLGQVVLERTNNGTPLLGICLGMQLLFDYSTEYGLHPGLGLIRGCVTSIQSVIPANLKTPHIGWNVLNFPLNCEKNPLFQYTNDGDRVYFVHSFCATKCAESVIATTEYGVALTAAVARDNIFGLQFHPEKSGQIGLDILRSFAELPN